MWALQFAQLLAGADAGGESGAGAGGGAEMLVVADWAPSVGFYVHEQGQLVRCSGYQWPWRRILINEGRDRGWDIDFRYRSMVLNGSDPQG